MYAAVASKPWVVWPSVVIGGAEANRIGDPGSDSVSFLEFPLAHGTDVFTYIYPVKITQMYGKHIPDMENIWVLFFV